MPTFKGKIYPKGINNPSVEVAVEAKSALEAKKLIELQYGSAVPKGFAPRKA